MSLIPIPPDVSVLNCGAGDMTFSFDKKDPQEAARAERVVTDMLKRGYLLFAKVKGKLIRVKAFDAKTQEYIIADGPESQPAAAVSGKWMEDPGPPPAPTTKGKRGRPRRVAASGTPVTGIAPTAGG